MFHRIDRRGSRPSDGFYYEPTLGFVHPHARGDSVRAAWGVAIAMIGLVLALGVFAPSASRDAARPAVTAER